MKHLIYLRNIILCSFLISLLFFIACTSNSVVFNEISSLSEGAPPFIEGTYSDAIDQDAFKEIAGIDISDCLPESYKSYAVSAIVQYDKDGEILNIMSGIGEDNNGFPVSISAYSPDKWSESGYSPLDYSFGDNESNSAQTSEIEGIKVVFFHYDDRKNSTPLGYDVFSAEFSMNDINFHAESNEMSEDEFKKLIISVISSG